VVDPTTQGQACQELWEEATIRICQPVLSTALERPALGQHKPTEVVHITGGQTGAR
jgi:hypothetical protein